MRVGFIGLGIMGKPMATNLLNAGHALFVHNRSQAVVEQLVRFGAVAQSSPKAVAESADVIITMLPDSPDVLQVVTGENGVIEGLSPGKIVIDMSSIDPSVTKTIAASVTAIGGHMVDAPVSGGETGAIHATLTIMVGGDEATFQRIEPILKMMGKTVVRVGDVGAGQAVKLVNQMMVAMNIATVSEALAFGRKMGLDLCVVYEAIQGGLAGSRVLDAKIGNVIEEQFVPGFRVELHKKDLANAIAMGNQVGADMQLTTLMLKMFEELMLGGYGSEDHSALYRLYRNQILNRAGEK